MSINTRAMTFWEREYFDVLTGEFLGSGVGRSVYVHRPNDAMVVKIEQEGGSFQNIKEYETWQAAVGTPLERWLAPCIYISLCGGVLIQARTRPLLQSELPEKIPTCLTDVKPENFGWLEDRVVAHDYGLLRPSGTVRLRKVQWT